MPESPRAPTRFIGLDIHKHYLVAYGVNRDQERVLPFARVANERLPEWIEQRLTPHDAVALEMTTNTWTMVDMLEPHVHSVLVVHPPEVKAIVKARVMTDKKAARILAKLHAARLLPPVWVPPQEIRELRALVGQRWKMVRLLTQAKNRLRSLLHRHHLEPPAGSQPFVPATRPWWEALPVEGMERFQLVSDLDTLAFAQRQVERLEQALGAHAVGDDRVPLLVQLPGVSLVTALTILAAVGEIRRFPVPEKLVGYAGLGAAVKDSGQSRRTGRITKEGRKDLRRVMVEAAHSASRTNDHWRTVYRRLADRRGNGRARVAVARKLLVAAWHVLTKAEADRYNPPEKIAASLYALAYRIGINQLPEGMTARLYVRHHLERLGVVDQVPRFRWGSKWVTIPPKEEVAIG